MRKRTIGLAAGCLALAAGAAITLALASGQVPVTEQTTPQAFVDCAALTTGAEVTAQDVALQCTDKALRSVAVQAGLIGLDSTLLEAEHLDPRVIQLCHSLVHAVARETYSTSEQDQDGSGRAALEALFKLDDNGCHGGVMHGSLEGWAAGSPTRDDYSELVQACVEPVLPETEENKWREAARTGRCADALGHAAWNTWKSAENCALFTNHTDQVNCSGGVLMQMYRPVGESRPVEGVSYPDLIDFCRNWPSSVSIDGCNYGVAYAFDHLVSDTLAQMGDSVSNGASLTPQQYTALSDALAQARGWCAKLPNDPDHLCESGLLVGDALYALNPRVPQRLCAELSSNRVEGCQQRFERGRG